TATVRPSTPPYHNRRMMVASQPRPREAVTKFAHIKGRAGCRHALKKTNGATDGDALIAAMKGMAWTRPRGPVSIDPETRAIIQNIYVAQVREDERPALQCGVQDHPETSRTR